jgi:Sec-independent protein translocase protein TatA
MIIAAGIVVLFLAMVVFGLSFLAAIVRSLGSRK